MNNIKKEKELNVACSYCGKLFHIKPSYILKNKKHYCSIECNKKDRSEYMSSSGNHQFGLKGSYNSSWKSDEKITNYGYKKIRCINHPFKDCDNFVFEHRLVAEEFLLNAENSISINGKLYLRKDYVVHHIDENKLNNKVENLLIVTKEEHAKIHHPKTNIKKKVEKSLSGFIKKCEICDNEFYTTNKNRKCCSVLCSNMFLNRGTSIVFCSNCGKEFKIKNSRLNKSKNIFCSSNCYFEYRRN